MSPLGEILGEKTKSVGESVLQIQGNGKGLTEEMTVDFETGNLASGVNVEEVWTLLLSLEEIDENGLKGNLLEIHDSPDPPTGRAPEVGEEDGGSDRGVLHVLGKFH